LDPQEVVNPLTHLYKNVILVEKLGKTLEKLKNVMLDLALERHFLLWYT